MIRALRTPSVLFVTACAALALLAGCAKERPRMPATIVVPSELGVNTVDVAGVYAVVRQHFSGEGVKIDGDRSDAKKGTVVTKSQRCAPVGDARHITTCIFALQIGESRANPQQVAVVIRVRTGGPEAYDPEKLAGQIAIEPLLDQLVTVLRNRYTFAEVKSTEQLSF